MNQAIAAHILFYNSAENIPTAYHTGYLSLLEFVKSCLDNYKEEMNRILFPVFVYSFLEMCDKGYWNEGITPLL